MTRIRKNHTIFSVLVTNAEKDILDQAVEDAGTNRNAMIREWINSLANKKG